MGSNSFGRLFKMTTWGESHGKAIGVVIDGCPAGIEISVQEINEALLFRSPGRNAFTTPRVEKDQAEILSGLFEGKTTGAPISILIPNLDADSSQYERIKDLLRPGHANFTFLEKYGIFDYRGGGRASARETASRVAAGAIAKKILKQNGIQIIAYIRQINHIKIALKTEEIEISELRRMTHESAIFCPDRDAGLEMQRLIEVTKKEGNSLGGVVEFIVSSLPSGLGDPVYDKLQAKLAYAMMSIPASKGFEIGSGFDSIVMKGSEHNDPFFMQEGQVKTQSNHAGGILGGISTGMPIIGRVAFKPTSSIMKEQKTVTTSGQETSYDLPAGSRHDPTVVIRAVPVVEAMAAMVLTDALLLNRQAKI